MPAHLGLNFPLAEVRGQMPARLCSLTSHGVDANPWRYERFSLTQAGVLENPSSNERHPLTSRPVGSNPWRNERQASGRPWPPAIPPSPTIRIHQRDRTVSSRACWTRFRSPRLLRPAHVGASSSAVRRPDHALGRRQRIHRSSSSRRRGRPCRPHRRHRRLVGGTTRLREFDDEVDLAQAHDTYDGPPEHVDTGREADQHVGPVVLVDVSSGGRAPRAVRIRTGQVYRSERIASLDHSFSLATLPNPESRPSCSASTEVCASSPR